MMRILTFIAFAYVHAESYYPSSTLIKNYTMNGIIPLEYFYVDERFNGSGTHYKYSIKDFVNSSRKIYSNIESEWVGFQNTCLVGGPGINSACKRFLKSYGPYFAVHNLQDTITNDSKIIIFGSAEPWLEGLLYSIGSPSVTTIDYNNLTYETGHNYPDIRTISSHEFESFYSDTSEYYDMAFSISSFDHDGLGRYGDPLDANADITAMTSVMKVLKPGGRLILTVPIGPDLVVYNLHRIYGRIRLPLLLEGWEIVDTLGWRKEYVDTETNWRQTYEPVFILRKPGDSLPHATHSGGYGIDEL